MKFKHLHILAIFLFTHGVAYTQFTEVTENAGVFYFDAVLVKSDSAGFGRLDVFILVPYSSMTFIKSGDIFGAEYEVSLKIMDNDKNIVDNQALSRQITESDYFATQGGNADFDYSQVIFNLPEGKYTIEVIYYDKTGNRSYVRTRTQTILNFDWYDFSISGLMIVNAIEEADGKFIITPHVSDNIGLLKEDFFVFFETYSRNLTHPEIDIIYSYIDSKGKEVFTSDKKRYKIARNREQHFLKVIIPQSLNQGSYFLKLFALQPNDNPDYEASGIMASSERSISYFRTIGGAVVDDLDKSIRQLRYVATNSEINYILDGQNESEKIMRFEEFWRKLDPTPNTDRNEAFDEYYSRIDYANSNFKSYMEGWRTDMGMVFIIYGPPMRAERNRMNDGRYYERWIYTNRQIVFVDYNGFGDYRLYSPVSIIDKYKYE